MTRRSVQFGLGILATLVAVALAPLPALADCTNIGPPGWANNQLSNLANLIWTLNGTLEPKSLAIGQSLFTLLATVEVGWFVVQTAVRKQAIENVFGSLGFKLVSLMTLLALMNFAGSEGQQWLSDMANAGTEIGSQAVNVPTGNLAQSAVTDFQTGAMNANALVACPFQGVMQAVQTKQGEGVFGAPMALLLFVELMPLIMLTFGLWLLTIVTYVFLLFQLLIAIVEAAIVLGGGVFILGFQGSRWTMPFSQSYWRYALAAGMRIFAIQMVIGLNNALLGTGLRNVMSGFSDPNRFNNPISVFTGFLPEAAALFAICAFTLFLARSAPKIAGSFLTGSPALTLSDAFRAGEQAAGIAALPTMAVAAAAAAPIAIGAAGAGGAGAAAAGGGGGAAAGTMSGAGAAGAGAGAGSGAAAGGSRLASPASAGAGSGGGRSGGGTPSPPSGSGGGGSGGGGSSGGGNSGGGSGGGARSAPSPVQQVAQAASRRVAREYTDLIQAHIPPPAGAAPDIRHSE